MKKFNVFKVLTLENAAFSTSVVSRQKVDVPVRRPVKLLVAHEVLQMDMLDDPTSVFTQISSLPGNLTDQFNIKWFKQSQEMLLTFTGEERLGGLGLRVRLDISALWSVDVDVVWTCSVVLPCSVLNFELCICYMR